MPIHEYCCLNCGLKFEYFVRSSNEEIRCPHCEHKDLKRLMSSFAFSSKDASGNITSSSAGCGSCTSNNCSTCSH